ncbi:peptide MFS transporter [Rhizosaccharibacter radicis]|uniref:Oligopeptide:H+ symporter n=1 Tax=Rhizosaccharibacter radicis TaxID=2782605 RepID=A0ABT1W0Y7_9PROT|nr:oligopeptide:H+ symporter [Acetobacteraceae bacterium KSS12]
MAVSALDPTVLDPADRPRQPDSRRRSFQVVLLVEIWERFGYYGMQALLLLFLVNRLGYADRDATLLWGAFAALTYAAPAIGGWLGDQVLGSRRAMVLGAAGLALGYGLLTTQVAGGDAGWLGMAMALVCVGNGLFKPNAGNLVRRIYENDDKRLDAAFTLYYMGVNIGATVSQLLTPWLRDRFGWPVAFGVCAIGLVLALGGYAVLRGRLRGIGSAPDERPVPARTALLVGLGIVVAVVAVAVVLRHAALARTCVWLAGLAILAAWTFIFQRATRPERPGLLVAYLLTLQIILFFIFYQQQSTSLTLFALRNVSPDFRVLGVTLFSFSAAQFQALNPIWIMVMSPVLAVVYNRLGSRGSDLPIAGKFLLGFGCVTAAFVLWWGCTFSGGSALVSPWALVWGYAAQSLGELLTSGLGLAMVARYAPQRLGAFMMGAFFVAVGVAMYLGSMVANLAALPPGLEHVSPDQTLPIYHALFGRLTLLGVGSMVLCAVALPWLRRWDRAHRLTVEAS